MSPVAAVKDSEKLSRKVRIANVVDDSIDEATVAQTDRRRSQRGAAL
jgi:hypothetical protein